MKEETKTTGLVVLKHTAENIKRLSAVHVEPHDNVLTIGGENGQGKTSVLDSIEWALGGKPDAPMPIKAGQTKARIVCELGEEGETKLVVKRTFTCDEAGKVNSYLEVTTPDGMKYQSPQAVLDRMLGTIALDPLEFSRKKPKDQIDILKACFGLDFSDLEQSRTAAFAERTMVNRQLDELKAKFAGMPDFPDAPAEEVSVAQLTAELEEAQRANSAVDLEQQTLDQLEFTVRGLREKMDLQSAHIEELKKQIAAAEEAYEKAGASLRDVAATVEQQREKLAALTKIDTTPIREKIASAETLNQQVRANRAIAEGRVQWNTLEEKRVSLTKAIEEADREKAARLAGAKLPVDGLTFDELGLYFQGVPFAQASAAEQIRVSSAIALAQNPRLKILLVRDGSLLDKHSMQALTDLAAKYGAQVWIEKVCSADESSAVSVFIEDGQIAGSQPHLELVEGAGDPVTKDQHVAELVGGEV